MYPYCSCHGGLTSCPLRNVTILYSRLPTERSSAFVATATVLIRRILTCLYQCSDVVFEDGVCYLDCLSP